MIKFVDMFSGIGGFREGLTRAGGFECVGHCEIDKYANRSYNALFDTKGEWFIEDARKADPSTMPDFQLLCGGFPCQTFSIAGSRKGFGDPRGTLFFELARLAEARKPSYLLFENVPGLLSHDGGRTFALPASPGPVPVFRLGTPCGALPPQPVPAGSFCGTWTSGHFVPKCRKPPARAVPRQGRGRSATKPPPWFYSFFVSFFISSGRVVSRS